MEELRDDRLSKIVSWLQAYIRGYLSRKEYKKLQEQRLLEHSHHFFYLGSKHSRVVHNLKWYFFSLCRVALQVVQRNLRKYLKLRTWPWWKLWQKVKPLLNVSRIEDEIAVSTFQHHLPD